jgi:hypothetical protein
MSSLEGARKGEWQNDAKPQNRSIKIQEKKEHVADWVSFYPQSWIVTI